MKPFREMTKADVDAHNAKVAARRRLPDAIHCPTFGPISSPPVERESDLHYAILEDCQRRGWLAFHGSTAHKARRTAGEPDFIVLTDCQFLPSHKMRVQRVLFVECKSAKGKRSPAQLQVEAHARKLGHTVHIVRSFEEWTQIAEGEI